jgi:hypothetical protein
MMRMLMACLCLCVLSGAKADDTLAVAQTVAVYGAAWNQTDAASVHKFLDKVWADKGQYADPTIRVQGRDALTAYILNFRAKVGTAQLTLQGPVAAHHGWFKFAWAVVASDGSVTLKGMDIGQLADDGRIKRIVGFFDTQI